MTIRTRAGRSWRIEGPARKSRPDKALIAGLHRAHGALNDRGFDLVNIKTPLNNARGAVDPYLRKLTALAFLAPDIQRAILEGWQPTDLRLKDFLSGTSPLDWHNQHKLLSLAQAGPATLQQSSCKGPAKHLLRSCNAPANALLQFA